MTTNPTSPAGVTRPTESMLKACPFCSNYAVRFTNELPVRAAGVRCYGCCAEVRIVGATSLPADLQVHADRMWNLRSPVANADAWQPIATAPRDGSAIWLFSPMHGMVEGSWEQIDGGGHPENGPAIYWWSSPYVEFIDGPYDAPTHWRPLPPPPKDAAIRAGEK